MAYVEHLLFTKDHLQGWYECRYELVLDAACKQDTDSREPGLLLNGCAPQAHSSAAFNFSFLNRWIDKGFGGRALKDEQVVTGGY